MARPSLKQQKQITENILKTSAKLFAEQGYKSTQMSQIQADCKIGKDTLYRRFESKQQLLLATMNYLQEQSTTKVDTLLKKVESLDVISQIKEICWWLFNSAIDDKTNQFRRIMLEYSMFFAPPNQGVFLENSEIANKLISLIESAQTTGLLIQLPADEIADMLITYIIYKPSFQKIMGINAFENPKAGEQYFEKKWQHAYALIKLTHT